MIGVKDLAPIPTTASNPTTSDFTLCGRIDRTVGSAETALVTCLSGGVFGRHLVVMIDSSLNSVLTVCEITAEGYREYIVDRDKCIKSIIEISKEPAMI